MFKASAAVNSQIRPPVSKEGLQALWEAAREIPIAAFIGAMDRLRLWYERASQRSELASLPPAALRDLGLAPEDVFREVSKPFWQA